MIGLSFKRLGAVTVIAAVSILSGCNLSGSSDTAKDVKSALKVMYYDERSFYDQFGTVFSATHPNVELSVVTNQNYSNKPSDDPEGDFQKFLDKENPDVLILDPNKLTKFVKEGKLLELDTLIAEKDYHQETLIPGLVDNMKELGEGKVYGLSPSFYSQAIFYNKDLFEKYNISLPQDKMSWQQLVELARRFPTDGPKDKRVYGLGLGYNSDVYQLGSMIGATENLSMFNATSGQVTINTPSWKNAFQTAVDVVKSDTLYIEDHSNNSGSSSYEDYLLRDPFVSGRLAMKLDGTYIMDQIKEAQNRIKDKAINNWDIVTVPVDPQNPDSSTYVNFGQIFVVNAKTTNPEGAKEFIRYITGEEYARVTSRIHNNGFSVRTTYVKDDDNHNLKAFYSLKPAQNNMYKDYDKLPPNFYMQFMNLIQQEVKGVVDGQKSIDAALDLAQTKGQQIMEEEKLKVQNNPPAPSSSTDTVSSSG